MRSKRKTAPRAETISLALTWDGSRCPRVKLSRAARAFLKGTESPRRKTSTALAAIFAGNGIQELRICWVPRLQGGDATLCVPFPTPHGLRMAFRIRSMVLLGDSLGVVYRRGGTTSRKHRGSEG